MNDGYASTNGTSSHNSARAVGAVPDLLVSYLCGIRASVGACGYRVTTAFDLDRLPGVSGLVQYSKIPGLDTT